MDKFHWLEDYAGVVLDFLSHETRGDKIVSWPNDYCCIRFRKSFKDYSIFIDHIDNNG
jgi:hypothetical protein